MCDVSRSQIKMSNLAPFEKQIRHFTHRIELVLKHEKKTNYASEYRIRKMSQKIDSIIAVRVDILQEDLISGKRQRKSNSRQQFRS